MPDNEELYEELEDKLFELLEAFRHRGLNNEDLTTALKLRMEIMKEAEAFDV